MAIICSKRGAKSRHCDTISPKDRMSDADSTHAGRVFHRKPGQRSTA